MKTTISIPVLALIGCLLFIPHELAAQIDTTMSDSIDTTVFASNDVGRNLIGVFGAYFYVIDRGEDQGFGIGPTMHIPLIRVFDNFVPFIRASIGIGLRGHTGELAVGSYVYDLFYLLASTSYFQQSQDGGHYQSGYSKQYAFVYGGGIRIGAVFVEVCKVNWSSDQQAHGISYTTGQHNFSYHVPNGITFRLGVLIQSKLSR